MEFIERVKSVFGGNDSENSDLHEVKVTDDELALLRGFERISKNYCVQKMLDRDDHVIVPIKGHDTKGKIGRVTYDQTLCLMALGYLSDKRINELCEGG